MIELIVCSSLQAHAGTLNQVGSQWIKQISPPSLAEIKLHDGEGASLLPTCYSFASNCHISSYKSEMKKNLQAMQNLRVLWL